MNVNELIIFIESAEIVVSSESALIFGLRTLNFLSKTYSTKIKSKMGRF